MECEKFDIVMMILITALAVAIGVMYVVVLPTAFVLFGIAAQCATEDQLGRFVAFTAAVVASAFAGYKAVDLLSNCRCRNDEDN